MRYVANAAAIAAFSFSLVAASEVSANCADELRDIDRRIAVATGRLKASPTGDIRRLREAAKTLEAYRYDKDCQTVVQSIRRILARFDQKLAPAKKLGVVPQGADSSDVAGKPGDAGDPRQLSDNQRQEMAKSAVSIFTGDSRFALEQALGEPVFSISQGNYLGRIRDVILTGSSKLSFLVLKVDTIRNLKQAWVRVPLADLSVHRPGNVYFLANSGNTIKNAVNVYFDNGRWVPNKQLERYQEEQQRKRRIESIKPPTPTLRDSGD